MSGGASGAGYNRSTAHLTRPAAQSIQDAVLRPFWTDDAAGPTSEPALRGAHRADLLVVGGGYTGLWTALQAKELDPGLRVVVLEGNTVGSGASGRNGGFCEASLTHGEANGELHFAAELPTLHRLGMENLDGIADTLRRYGLDAEFERTGQLAVATEPHQLEWLATESGPAVTRLDAAEMRSSIDSPLYLGGEWSRHDTAMVHPAKLVWGLKQACLELGVTIAEHSPARALRREGERMVVQTPHGSVEAARVALGTNAFPALLARARPYVIAVYDYVLMTEPLSDAQLASIGWSGRQGVGDLANQFHYYRLSADNRILWGGYDAIYHYGGRVNRAHEDRPATFQKLAEQFLLTFPQLEGIRFTHRWGGAIDTCTRFAPFFGTAHGGRVAYTAGFTGLGVGSSRWAARVLIDLLSGEQTELTELGMVRSKPIPWPAEPLTYPLVELTRRSLNRADARGGRRNLLLRAMDAAGVGFAS
ncbi:NAD(P)/FAD-dependent oxidoreductase [Subtercola boreus]|uniref:FAD-dependent oxidoreductase n=1 Tax=Subtercola boreus TaxID=120213 RepID=A0A3E0WAW3_9MICO|nr:FAD-binding oxidoreductase [Subtercola boreus]RFA21174.1 FAD-dependent oxidoreductase [Subtercola boreus]RFA21557.1 FAD-dependent oxidoreductase [Subtercola boreus]RFA27527.1 FAD-dependent oxidoreductase [Subtercola boreus]